MTNTFATTLDSEHAGQIDKSLRMIAAQGGILEPQALSANPNYQIGACNRARVVPAGWRVALRSTSWLPGSWAEPF